jgi:hypothetical protein
VVVVKPTIVRFIYLFIIFKEKIPIHAILSLSPCFYLFLPKKKPTLSLLSPVH